MDEIPTPEQIALAYAAYIRRIARNYPKLLELHTEDDLIQEALYEITNALKKGQYKKGNIKAWIGAVAKHSFQNLVDYKDRSKRAGNRLELTDELLETLANRHLFEHELSPKWENQEQLLRIVKVGKAMRSLTPMQRTAVMHFLNRMSFDEMAEKFGGTNDKWRMNFNTAIASLQRKMNVTTKKGLLEKKPQSTQRRAWTRKRKR